MSWIANSNIVTGLPNNGTYSRPCAFLYNGDLFLFEAKYLNAFKFNTVTESWEDYPDFETFEGTLPSSVVTVFTFNGNLYLIVGLSSGLFSGWKYNSSTNIWEIDYSITEGLTDVGSAANPCVFEKNSDLYLISGNTDGTFFGFKWNSVLSEWETNNEIVTGLPDVGSWNRLTVYLKGGYYYLISGNSTTSGLYGFKWNSTLSEWESDNVADTLSQPGSYAVPTSFYFNNILYLIVGGQYGSFLGFEMGPAPKLQSIEITKEFGDVQLVVTLSEAATDRETIKAYLDVSVFVFNNNYPSNEIILETSDNTIFTSQLSLQEGDNYYVKAEQVFAESIIDEITDSGAFFVVPQVETTIINITDPLNHVTLNNPVHSMNHGLIYMNGFLFGSARGEPYLHESSLFKLSASDYTVLSQIKIFQDKNNSLNQITNFDQLVSCKSFIWMHRGEFLIRVNPSDLDYMVFSGLPLAAHSTPPCSDGIYLYLSTDTAVHKIDVNLLTGAFESYNYTGSSAVAVPTASILSNAAIISHSATYPAFSHSSLVDDQFIFVAVTTTYTSVINGYDPDTNTHFFHFQKIDKNTMQTVGDVIIPKCTDDMVQNGEYVFLAPEYQSTTEDLFGYDWGLLAIHKQTLELKYLKALHGDFIANLSSRSSYGLFYTYDKIAVLLIDSKKTVIIDTSQVDKWGEYFPVGGATDAIYSYHINGAELASVPNELVVDNAGYIHLNTWEENTIVFKFSNTEMPDLEKTPNIQTTLISSSSNNATIGGYVIDEGISEITDVGFRYGTDPESLTTNVDVSPDSYDFQTLLESLAPGIYYIQAWGVNTEGTWYGNTVVFSTYNEMTLSNDDDDALLEWVNENYGCSIRCVQDAPGVADGETGTATDQDGNVYNTVVINEKRWFVENLKVTTYRDGTPIPNITDNTEWSNDEDGAYSTYDNK